MKLEALANDEPKTSAETVATNEGVPRKRRGFAAMDPSVVRAIAQKGGLAAHAHGTAHAFTSEEARAAGSKGGTAPHRWRGRKPVSRDVTGAAASVDPE